MYTEKSNHNFSIIIWALSSQGCQLLWGRQGRGAFLLRSSGTGWQPRGHVQEPRSGSTYCSALKYHFCGLALGDFNMPHGKQAQHIQLHKTLQRNITIRDWTPKGSVPYRVTQSLRCHQSILHCSAGPCSQPQKYRGQQDWEAEGQPHNKIHEEYMSESRFCKPLTLSTSSKLQARPVRFIDAHKPWRNQSLWHMHWQPIVMGIQATEGRCDHISEEWGFEVHIPFKINLGLVQKKR